MTLIRSLTLCCLVLCVPSALAGRLEIPLRVPFEPLRQALSAQLAASPARPNVIYREGRCRYLNLEAPKLDAVDGHLRLVGPGSAALGVEFSAQCQNAADWNGTMQFTLAPQIDNAGRLRMRIVDSRLSDAGGGSHARLHLGALPSAMCIRAWNASATTSAPRATALLAVMRGAAPPATRAELEAALKQLQVLQPRIEPNARSWCRSPSNCPTPGSTAPAAANLANAAPAAPLTEAELDALEKALQPWDAFLLYSIKQLALDSKNNALRTRLFTLLLESRYRLTEILSGEAPAAGDPLRELFMDAWNELRTILADAQRDGVLDTSLLRYAAFIDAGDALLALDRAAPGLGMTLSADGLRQLARSLRPGAAATRWPTTGRPIRNCGGSSVWKRFPIPSPRLRRRSWLDLLIRPRTRRPSGAAALDRWVPQARRAPRLRKARWQLLQQDIRERAAARQPRRAVRQHLSRHGADHRADRELLAPIRLRGGKVSYLRSAAAASASCRSTRSSGAASTISSGCAGTPPTTRARARRS